MKKWYRLPAIILFAVMTTGFSSSPAVSADDKSCRLEAQQTVYLSIYDLDSRGSILAHIWEGVLGQGDKKLIKSSNGKIRYYTNPNAAASSQGINLMCNNGEIISVP
jgi:hypothetical protein